jgi:ATP-dependent DNA helicase
MFRGLHIGIDRYADPHIQWLSGAVRDAEALHALYADTFGTGPVLLADQAATASAIRAALTALAPQAADGDMVTITYAGHGSEDHYLIPYDGDIGRISDTCISLDELADRLSAIQGATLFCALDCCFSGGLGARVFSSGLRPRAAPAGSPIDVLDRVTGNGRIVLTRRGGRPARHGIGAPRPWPADLPADGGFAGRSGSPRR